MSKRVVVGQMMNCMKYMVVVAVDCAVEPRRTDEPKSKTASRKTGDSAEAEADEGRR